ncbi:MAG: DNA cytosine methyltransferase [Parvularculaceae bacterium]
MSQIMTARAPYTFLEFFAGGGMARLGLGQRWRCLFANDFDAEKRLAYGANFGLDHYRGGDIHSLSLADFPKEQADLAWASSPCQDLSLAGARAGLKGARSGAFFGFWRLMEVLDDAGHPPRSIVIENVAGLLTSHDGGDFAEIARLFVERGYAPSAFLLNADGFAPQSRPRLFILGVKDAAPIPACEIADERIAAAVARMPRKVASRWRWISLPPARGRNRDLIDILENDAPLDPVARTRKLLAEMTPLQRRRIDALARSGGAHAGAAFRRIRIENGERKPRIEARFDGLAGCIRTPAGGSSRQIIFLIENGKIRSRLMTPREAARAMGLGDDYTLPEGSTAALKLIGDGVAPPVVRHLAEYAIEPSLSKARAAA